MPMFAADDYLEAMKLTPGYLPYQLCWHISLVIQQALQSLHKSPDHRIRLPAPRSIGELAIQNDAMRTYRRIFQNRLSAMPKKQDLCFSFTT